MKHAHAMAYLEQLCSLGLGGELIIPAVLQALHAIIPSQHNAFYWVDAQYRICNMVDELPLPELATRYDTALAAQLESPKPIGYGSYAAPYPFFDAQRLAHSELFTLGLCRKNTPTSCHTVIRNAGHPCGLLVLHRRANETPFTPDERTCLAEMAMSISQALSPPSDITPMWTDSGDCGLILLNCQGNVVSLSSRAQGLLWYATHPQITPRVLARAANGTVPSAVQQLATRFTSGRQDTMAMPSVLTQRNSWGQFVYRAFLMEEAQPVWGRESREPSASSHVHIGLTVQHQEPFQLTLMRAMQALPLSRREREVCLGLAEGLAYSHIAAHLQVSSETVLTCVRRIYAKLEGQQHDELFRKLEGRV